MLTRGTSIARSFARRIRHGRHASPTAHTQGHAYSRRPPCAGASCGIACTVIGPCPAHQPLAACAPDCTLVTPCLHTAIGACPTHQPQATCAAGCTHNFLCLQTPIEPQCGFRTEVTCIPAYHQTLPPPCVASPAPACGPNITIGCSVACLPWGLPGQLAAGAAAVRAAPQSVGGCGQSVGADCTAADLCTINQCPSQFATCMPIQTCIPNVCTVDSVCCQTAFAICPPTPVNPCVNVGATCAPMPAAESGVRRLPGTGAWRTRRAAGGFRMERDVHDPVLAHGQALLGVSGAVDLTRVPASLS